MGISGEVIFYLSKLQTITCYMLFSTGAQLNQTTNLDQSVREETCRPSLPAWATRFYSGSQQLVKSCFTNHICAIFSYTRWLLMLNVVLLHCFLPFLSIQLPLSCCTMGLYSLCSCLAEICHIYVSIFYRHSVKGGWAMNQCVSWSEHVLLSWQPYRQPLPSLSQGETIGLPEYVL